MTCAWKLEHQPCRTPWKVARRRVCLTDEAPICGALVTWLKSGSSPPRILSNPSPCKLSPLRNSGGALPAEMAVPFCVLQEGQASSCTEPAATWQRLNAEARMRTISKEWPDREHAASSPGARLLI